nr:hypothetical protein [uncultured Methanolobus sp.]
MQPEKLAGTRSTQIIISFLILISCTVIASADQTNDSDKYTFTNYGGEVYTPQPMEFGANLNGNESVILENGTETKHVYLQFYDNATDEQLLLLEEYEIQILNFAAYYTYVASMPADYTAADLPSESRLRWMGEIPVENKYDQNYGLNVPNYAKLEDGNVKLGVIFYEDITLQDSVEIMQKYSNNISTHVYGNIDIEFEIITAESNISLIAKEDAVEYVGYFGYETIPCDDSDFVEYEEIIEEDESDIADEIQNNSQETVENINDSEGKEAHGFTATIAILICALIATFSGRKD